MKTRSVDLIKLIGFASILFWNIGFAQTGLKITNSNCVPFYPCVLGDKIFYMGQTNTNGYEPWACFKNGKGAYMIKDIKAGNASGMDQVNAAASKFRVLNGYAYFFADDGVYGMELWKTDGTASGTTMVKDITVGAGGYKGQFTSEEPLNGNIIFYANDGNGFDLWKTDGTAAGTTKITNLKLSAAPYFVFSTLKKVHIVLSNKMFFFLNSEKLQVLDGNTFTLTTLESGSSWTPIYPLISFQNQIYFFRQTGNIVSMWKTDGTLANTVLVKNNLYTAVYNGNTYPPMRSVVASNRMYIEMKLTTTGTYFTSELWKSDGTSAGTELIKAFYSQLNDMQVINDKLYFSAFLDNQNNGIWTSDGTAANTSLFYSFNLSKYTSFGGPGVDWSSCFNNLNDSLIFYKMFGSNNGVYLTNGALNGTNKVMDINSIREIFVDSSVAYIYNGYDIYRYPSVTATSVHNEVKFTEFNIYPNPASDFIKIECSKNYELTISSVTGKILLVEKNKKEISLTDFQPGLYILRIETDNRIITKKIIKN